MPGNSNVVEKLNEIAVLLNETRLKILIALYNSERFKIDNKKIGSNSHSLSELETIIQLSNKSLEPHLKFLVDSKYVVIDKNKSYHITDMGKKILNEAGISDQLVFKIGEELGYNVAIA